MSRAAWARVRTGTGPSLAAMPPNASRASSTDRAPSSAARRAAKTPAGPAPITMMSVIDASCRRAQCLKRATPGNELVQHLIHRFLLVGCRLERGVVLEIREERKSDLVSHG